MSCGDRVELNGKVYVAEAAVVSGKRAVVVVDRGWIFAGDVERKNGRLTLTRAVWVFNWSEIGFDGALKDPKNPKVEIRKLDNAVDMPEAAEIFCVPVCDSWGL